MKDNKKELTEQELKDRVDEIIAVLKDEDFTNIKKRLQFASLIIELITSSNDQKVRKIIKKLGDAVTEIVDEINGTEEKEKEEESRKSYEYKSKITETTKNYRDQLNKRKKFFTEDQLKEKRGFDVVDFVIAYESGDLTEDEIIKGFQELLDRGQLFSLQGHYGRVGQALIDAGLIKKRK